MTLTFVWILIGAYWVEFWVELSFELIVKLGQPKATATANELNWIELNWIECHSASPPNTLTMDDDMKRKSKGMEIRDHRGTQEITACLSWRERVLLLVWLDWTGWVLIPMSLVSLETSLACLCVCVAHFLVVDVHSILFYSILLWYYDLAAANSVYRRAIIHAIDQLQDHNLRSHIDSIRRHVQTSLSADHVWNDTIFLKTMKGLMNDGDIEQCAKLNNCSLSLDLKKRRTTNMMTARLLHVDTTTTANTTTNSIPVAPLPPLSPHQQQFPSYYEATKDAPKRKMEHAKLKIIPKKIYDNYM